MQHLSAPALRALATNLRTKAAVVVLPSAEADLLDSLLAALAGRNPGAALDDVGDLLGGRRKILTRLAAEMLEEAQKAEDLAAEKEKEGVKITFSEVAGDPAMIAAALLLRFGGRVVLAESELKTAYEQTNGVGYKPKDVPEGRVYEITTLSKE